MSTEISANIFEQVYDVILERKNKTPDKSYVASLMNKGTDSILKKIGEESAEVIIAAKNEDRKEIIHEITDLWFHLLILMGHQDISIKDIYREMERRFGQSGLEEKAQR
ncbi:MAG: phosphoribosyl-ATP diphosphatase [SAR324 cluster bacterium]|nr:phosphoribosyl-ATP diphosphatase [SAR324 cluster bacterium]MBL7034405.1 phosphoribosyl-ATP diphosphatase [SAR324 cluster bacterium]